MVTGFLYQFTVFQLQNTSHVTQPECYSPYLHNPSILSYPKTTSIQPIHLQTIYFICILILFSHLCLSFQNDLFFMWFSNTSLYSLYLPFAPCTHLFEFAFLSLITVVILDVNYLKIYFYGVSSSLLLFPVY
jgi:hypothetical protein